MSDNMAPRPSEVEGGGGELSDLKAIRSRATAELQRSRATPKLVEAVAAREADDRPMIAKWVMRGAGASIAAVYLFLFVKAVMTGQREASAQT